MLEQSGSQRTEPRAGWLRRFFRRALLRFVARLLATDDGRRIIKDSIDGLLARRVLLPPPASAPYADLPAPAASPPRAAGAGPPPIFITARFRSGSTFLWNIFRNIDGHTSYYEPLNERRWFDPSARGDRVDATHKNVEEYWREYEGLEELGEWYREDWIRRDLYMDATSWAPEMRRYIEVLVARARGRAVLQFNRVDFRLAWLRVNFPEAKILHLYRHPRDQWVSSLFRSKFPKDGTVADFRACDHFYLLLWAQDLKYHFPFLDERAAAAAGEHPYRLFYYIWKLSYLFGREHAHFSIGFEDLVADPRARLVEMFEAADVRGYDLDRLVALLVKPDVGKWKEYADAAWFERHEAECERVLARFLGTAEPAPRAARPAPVR